MQFSKKFNRHHRATLIKGKVYHVGRKVSDTSSCRSFH
uniref:Uncharacterized protein n=1 Tax=Rhizophora mucronata TaxID=61149 RepID=A0A2P2PSM9_RHIMU